MYLFAYWKHLARSSWLAPKPTQINRLFPPTSSRKTSLLSSIAFLIFPVPTSVIFRVPSSSDKRSSFLTPFSAAESGPPSSADSTACCPPKIVQKASHSSWPSITWKTGLQPRDSRICAATSLAWRFSKTPALVPFHWKMLRPLSLKRLGGVHNLGITYPK
jgi:hypothetical protein